MTAPGSQPPLPLTSPASPALPGSVADLSTQRGPFRIHVVAALTGVPEPTLRAWERRYGIPTPERTTSGYRLYAARDVELVREMRHLCNGGMAAAEAAKLLLSGHQPPSAEATPHRDVYALSSAALLDAVTRFDDAALDLELRRLLLLGSTTTIVDRVLVPLLHDIGSRWRKGEVSVAQEHLTTHRVATLLHDLLRLIPAPAEGRSARAVLASFADDEHELGLLATAIRFSTWHLRPVFLGARTPPGALGGAVERVAPALVALSVTVAPEKARARELVDHYAHACGGIPWIVGGSGAATIADLIRDRGGEVAPQEPAELRALVRSMLEPREGRRAARSSDAKAPRKKR